jgi:hypothetical protein
MIEFPDFRQAGIGVGLGVQRKDAHGRCALGRQVADHFGHSRTRPRPVAELPYALFIDGDDDDGLILGAAKMVGPEIVVLGFQVPPGGQRGQHADQDQGTQQSNLDRRRNE